VPERLRRLGYTFQRLPIYFVTACTHQREKILDRADIHTRLAEFGKERPEHGACLGAYVLMPDHSCICCDRRSTAGPLRLDEMLEECFFKSSTRTQRAIASLAKSFPLYGTSRLGGMSLGGILAKIRAFPYQKRALFSLQPIAT
jgi:hypothetical protein